MPNLTTRNKAIAAQALLNNELLNEIFTVIRERGLSEWERSSPSDTEIREMIYNRVKAIQEVKREMQRALDAQLIEEKK